MSNKKGVKKALNSGSKVVSKKEVAGKAPEGRPKRIPLAQQFKLSIPTGIKEDGFAYRYIRDKTERVEAFENAWWVPVLDGNGRAIKKASGSGGYLLLYKIEKEYYDQDVQEKKKRNIDLLVKEAKIQKGNKYSSEYVPDGQEGVVVINN